MDASLLELITKNFGAAAAFVVGEVLAIIAIWKYFIAQGDKKDEASAKKDIALEAAHASEVASLKEALALLVQQANRSSDKDGDRHHQDHNRTIETLNKLDSSVEELNKMFSNFLIYIQEKKP